MPFCRATTWKERSLQLQGVTKKCDLILERLALSEDDARSQGFIHVRQLCNTIAAVPIILMRHAEDGSTRPAVMRLFGIHELKTLESWLSDLNKNAKLSFITMVQFALENCIECVLNALPRVKALGKFSKSARRLIEVAKINDPEIKHQILMVPAWIRNTLHAAGIHSYASKTVNIDGIPYVFEKGQRFSCGSWSHLFHAIQHALDVYEEMICSTVVVSIQKIDIA
jgi:hypothetical protein